MGYGRRQFYFRHSLKKEELVSAATYFGEGLSFDFDGLQVGKFIFRSLIYRGERSKPGIAFFARARLSLHSTEAMWARWHVVNTEVHGYTTRKITTTG